MGAGMVQGYAGIPRIVRHTHNSNYSKLRRTNEIKEFRISKAQTEADKRKSIITGTQPAKPNPTTTRLAKRLACR